MKRLTLALLFLSLLGVLGCDDDDAEAPKDTLVDGQNDQGEGADLVPEVILDQSDLGEVEDSKDQEDLRDQIEPTPSPVENIGPEGGFIPSIVFGEGDRIWLSGDDASGLYLREGEGDWVLQRGVPVDWSSYSIALDPQDPDIIYLPNHFGRGLVKSVDGGEQWVRVGEGLPKAVEEHRVEDFVVDPGDSAVVYAACEGGLYRSVDSGAHFAHLDTSTFTTTQHFSALETLSIPTPTVFVGDNKGGVYQSQDQGETWEVLLAPSPLRMPVSDLVHSGHALYIASYFGRLEKLNTSNPGELQTLNSGEVFVSGFSTRLEVVPGQDAGADILYVATFAVRGSEDWGFFYSDDGGQSFTRRVVDHAGFFTVAVDPEDPDHILLGSTGGGVFESWDAGLSFERPNQGIMAGASFGFAADPDDPDHILVSSSAGAEGASRVYETKDGGDSWAPVRALDFDYFMSFGFFSDGALLAGTFDRGLYRSTSGVDGPWTQVIVPIEKASIREFAVDSGDSGRLYAITDEPARESGAQDVGIYRSDDLGETWTRAQPFPVYDIDPHPEKGDEVVVATQDIYRTVDGFETVAPLGLLDHVDTFCTSTAFDPQDPSRLLVGDVQGRIFLCEGYPSCTWSTMESPAQGVLITDIEALGGALYASAWTGDKFVQEASTPGILKSTDGGATWSFLEGLYPSTLAWKLTPAAREGELLVGLWGGGFLRLTHED